MTQELEMPDGTVIEFPDEATPEQMQAGGRKYLASQPAPGAQQGPPMPAAGDLEAMQMRSRARDALHFRDENSWLTSPTSDLFQQGFTLGLQKPASGVANAIAEGLHGNNPFTAYTAGAKAYQDVLDEKRANAGIPGTIAEGAGAVFAGGPGGVTKGVLPTVKNAAVIGGIRGGAEESDKGIAGAAKGAVSGAALDAATAGTLKTVAPAAKATMRGAAYVMDNPWTQRNFRRAAGLAAVVPGHGWATLPLIGALWAKTKLGAAALRAGGNVVGIPGNPRDALAMTRAMGLSANDTLNQGTTNTWTDYLNQQGNQ
jgi:hypothetical protein